MYSQLGHPSLIKTVMIASGHFSDISALFSIIVHLFLDLEDKIYIFKKY